MTKEEFLLDTLEYYSADVNRRCISDSLGYIGCKYHPKSINKSLEESEGCGIGRKLKPVVAMEWDEKGVGDIETAKWHESKLFLKAPKWMQKMNIDFLLDLQTLHDQDVYWNKKKGISPAGKMKVRRIIKEYELDRTLFTKYIKH